MTTPDRPRLVLVGGGTASGKSTIVARFVADTGAVHIGHDRYYRDAPDPKGHDFDHPDALETDLLVQHVDALLAGRSVDLPIYGFPDHRRRPETERVEAHPLIVVEGILVLTSEALVERAEIVAFVDASEDVRLARRLQRDATERGRTAESVMHQYETTVRPAHDRYVEPGRQHAHVVLDGTAPVEENVARLIERLV